MQTWNLHEIACPDGTRSPVVLHSEEGVARAVLISNEPGGKLGDHHVKEHAWVTVVSGMVRIEAGGQSVEAGPGSVAKFVPDERHSLSSEGGARIMLQLAPWPGEGH